MKWCQQVQEELGLAIATANTHLADELELAVAEDAEQQRGNEVLTPTSAETVSADDKLAGLAGAYFLPYSRLLARGIGAELALRDDALETVGGSGVVERHALLGDEVGDLDDAIRLQSAVEDVAPLKERPVQEPLSVDRKQIEDLVDDRRAFRRLHFIIGAKQARPEQLERGQAFRAPGEDLAVDNGLATAETFAERLDLRVERRKVAQVATVQSHRRAVDLTDGAHAAPLHFEDAVGRVEGFVDDDWEHRAELIDLWGSVLCGSSAGAVRCRHRGLG